MKVVINRKHGGFGLSSKALKMLLDMKSPIVKQYQGEDPYVDPSNDTFRSHPDLVKVVEILGVEANGRHANLKIVEIPADVVYIIDDYNGMEHIAETHRTWR